MQNIGFKYLRLRKNPRQELQHEFWAGSNKWVFGGWVYGRGCCSPEGWDLSDIGQADEPPYSWDDYTWKKIEVYVKYNAPGSANGIERIWFDGNLAYEKTNAEFRGCRNKKD